MFLELAEALDCPECREGHGLVAFVDDITDRRIRTGWLGCPLCEHRFPVREGVVDLRAAREPTAATPAEPAAPRAGLGAQGEDDPRGSLIAALWGLDPEARGYWALGPSVHRLAREIGERFPGLEILALSGGDTDLCLPARVNALTWVSPASWPIRSHGLRGVAIGGADAPALAEAVRGLGPGARLVVLDPTPGIGERVEQAGLRILAADERALVASRS